MRTMMMGLMMRSGFFVSVVLVVLVCCLDETRAVTTVSVSCPALSPAVVAPGKVANFSTVVKSSASITNAVISFEIYNASSSKVYQTYKKDILLPANTAVTISASWSIPLSQSEGNYSTKILVYGANWTPLYVTKSTCSKFVIARPPPTISISCSPLSHVSALSGSNASVTSFVISDTQVTGAVVSFEFYNSSAAKIFQTVRSGITLAPAVSVSVAVQWPIPATQLPGTYSVKVLVFGANFQPLYSSRSSCAAVDVLRVTASNCLASPSSVAPGSVQQLSASVLSDKVAVSNAVVTFTVIGSTAPSVLSTSATVSLVADTAQTVSASWTVPSSYPSGQYTVQTTVAGAGLTLFSRDSCATFSVAALQTDISISCPTTVSRIALVPGSNVSLSTTLRSNGQTVKDALVSFEIYNASSARVYQVSSGPVTLLSNVAQTVYSSWKARADQAPGNYSLKVLVFDSAKTLLKSRTSCSLFLVRKSATSFGYTTMPADPLFAASATAYNAMAAKFPRMNVALSPTKFGLVDPDPGFAFLASKFSKVKSAGLTPMLHGGPVPTLYSVNGVRYLDTNKWNRSRIAKFVEDVAPALNANGVKDVTWEQEGKGHYWFTFPQNNTNSIADATVYCKRMRALIPGVRIWGPYTTSGIKYTAQTLAWKTHLDSGLFDGLAWDMWADNGWNTTNIDRNAQWLRDYNTHSGTSYQIWWTEYHDVNTYAQRCYHLAYIASTPEYAIINYWDPTGSDESRMTTWYSNGTLSNWGVIFQRLYAFAAHPVTRVSDNSTAAVFSNTAGATLHINKIANTFTFVNDQFVARAQADSSSTSTSSSSNTRILIALVVVAAILVVIAVVVAVVVVLRRRQKPAVTDQLNYSLM